MIALGAAEAAAVDDAVDAALSRLAARAQRHGEGSSALVEAIRAAAAGGKRFRPALVVAAFDAFGGDADDTPALWQVAAAFELLHTAFVIHDDLIDRDLERRGSPNVAGRFRARARAYGAAPEAAAIVGDAAAVLAGDLLLFEASRLVACAPASDHVRSELLTLLDDAILVSAAGELRDVENASRQEPPDAADLLATAHDKTGPYSFGAPLAAGAVLAGATVEQQRVIAASAADLGLAFQLVDDLIGTFGTKAQAGRAPGADLREAKRTPLIALARQSADWTRVSSALALAPTGPIALRRAQRVLDRSGARAEMVALVGETLDRSRRRVSDATLPAPATTLLTHLASAIERRIP
jgi:geranylgeranyl pyrophosphate synthase